LESGQVFADNLVECDGVILQRRASLVDYVPGNTALSQLLMPRIHQDGQRIPLIACATEPGQVNGAHAITSDVIDAGDWWLDNDEVCSMMFSIHVSIGPGVSGTKNGLAFRRCHVGKSAAYAWRMTRMASRGTPPGVVRGLANH
jgi:hypothetical protein